MLRRSIAAPAAPVLAVASGCTVLPILAGAELTLAMLIFADAARGPSRQCLSIAALHLSGAALLYSGSFLRDPLPAALLCGALAFFAVASPFRSGLLRGLVEHFVAAALLRGAALWVALPLPY